MVLKGLGAHIPSRGISGDVENLSHIFAVHVTREVVTENDFIVRALQMLCEGCVLLHRVATLVGLLFAVNHSRSDATGSFKSLAGAQDRIRVDWSVQVVPVEVCGKVVNFVPGIVTDLGLRGLVVLGVEVVVAIVVIESFKQ